MYRILLNGVDGNFGGKAAKVLLEKWPHEDLIFTAPKEAGLAKWKDRGVETRIADFNDPEGLEKAYAGADTMILISMPFVGPRRRKAQKTALDAAVKAGVRRVVYTSIVGAGEKDIDTYEVNDHVWFEAYIREQPIHCVFMRDSQYAEAMVSYYVNACENTDNVLANNMADGKMAYISRDDCAVAAACAAMSEKKDTVINVNGAELLTVSEYIAIANEVTGHHVEYRAISDEEQYAFFDSIGVPRTTEQMWAQTAVFTNDFEELVGKRTSTED